MLFQELKRRLIGKPLRNEMLIHEKIPKWKALAILSSDALSSVAYATEEILIPLSLFSISAMMWSIPLALAVGALLLIITLSYRQTIASYPSGGGSYIVSKENLGAKAGLVAGSALLIDYILTVAVSISAGVENIAAAFPTLAEYKVAIGIFLVLLIMLFNLRGVKESASIFALPTYLFIGSFILLIGVGLYKVATGSGVNTVSLNPATYEAIPFMLIIRAFSSGCSALTGVEAISNGVPLFRDPAPRNAKITMIWMSLILGTFFLGITLLAHFYHVQPTEGRTVIASLALQVFGENFLFYLVQFSVSLILILAANTAYADFPRLSYLLAKDGYLPKQLSAMGDRLVFSNGIIGLSMIAMLLLIIFKGHTHSLIPLYAVGVFLSFTLSQVGMIVHHYKIREPNWQRGLVINAIGALTTFIILIVISVSKFTHGAWAVVLLIPCCVFLFQKIHDHYEWVRQKLFPGGYYPSTKVVAEPCPVIVPISGIHPGVVKALNYACSISEDVRACYVSIDANEAKRMQESWSIWAGKVKLEILDTPFRSVIVPVVNYIDEIKKQNPTGYISVVIPEFVVPKWYMNFLHNQTAVILRTMLRFRKRIVIVAVRYHIDDEGFN